MSRHSTYDQIYNSQILYQLKLYRLTLGLDIEVFKPIKNKNIYNNRSQSYSYNTDPEFISNEIVINTYGTRYYHNLDQISSLFNSNKPTMYIVDNFEEYSLFSKIKLKGFDKYEEYLINEITNFYDTNKLLAYSICTLIPYTSNDNNLLNIDDEIGFNQIKKDNLNNLENNLTKSYNIDWKINIMED